MYTVKFDQAELMQLPKRDVRCYIGSEKMETPVKSERITMGMTEVPPGTDMIPHMHEIEEEIIYVMEGTGTVTIGGVTETIEPLTAAIFPVGLEHQVKSTGDVPLRFVFMFSPVFNFGR